MLPHDNLPRARATAHILYMDVVDSGLLPMEELRAVYERLNALVRETPEYDRAETTASVLSRPSGDGMALVLFSSLDAPAHCALELAAALKRYPNIRLRMGIHSGDVLRVHDINAHEDVTGEGIILAKRTMDCGDAGHILVSGSVAERLEKTETWKDFLHYIGVCETKHAHKVALWNLHNAAVGNPKLPQQMVNQIAQNALTTEQTVLASMKRPTFKNALFLLYALLIGVPFLSLNIPFAPPELYLLIRVLYCLLLAGTIAYLIHTNIQNKRRS